MVPKLHSRTLNSRSENMCTIYFTRHYWSTFQNMCMNSNPTSNVWVSLSAHSFTCCIYRESSTHMTMSSSQKITASALILSDSRVDTSPFRALYPVLSPKATLQKPFSPPQTHSHVTSKDPCCNRISPHCCHRHIG